MRTEEEIADEMREKLLYLNRTSDKIGIIIAMSWLQCLEWVLETEA